MLDNHLLQRYSAYADFERDCIELATLLPYPLEQIKRAAKQTAYASTHPNYWVPGHLCRLIKNKRHLEKMPAPFPLSALLVFPTECEQGCMKRFSLLLGMSE